MVTASNDSPATRTLVSSAEYSLVADTTPPKGEGEGFRPHELLESALASCTAITVRLAAKERGIPLKHLSVRVDLDRTDPVRLVFHTEIQIDNDLSEVDRNTLIAAARLCPVRKTLSRAIAFEEEVT